MHTKYHPKKRPKPKTRTPLPGFHSGPTPALLCPTPAPAGPAQTACSQAQGFYQRLFDPLVTLWYLLFQRLHWDHSLEAALSDARAGGADRINKKLSGNL